MKMIKYIFLMVPFFLITFGCEMTPTERTGIVELKISGPGTENKNSEGEISKTISMDALSLVLIAYPSFDDGIPEDVSLGNLGEIYPQEYDAIINGADTLLFLVDLNLSQTVLVTGIEPGDWSFMAFAFNTEITDISNMYPYDSTSYFFKKNVTITGGYNYLDAPLGINNSYYPLGELFDGYNGYTLSTNAGQSCFLIFPDVTAGTFRLDNNYTTPPTGTIILFYDDDSNLLSSTYEMNMMTESYGWTLTIPSTTNSLIIEIYNPGDALDIYADRSPTDYDIMGISLYLPA